MLNVNNKAPPNFLCAASHIEQSSKLFHLHLRVLNNSFFVNYVTGLWLQQTFSVGFIKFNSKANHKKTSFFFFLAAVAWVKFVPWIFILQLFCEISITGGSAQTLRCDTSELWRVKCGAEIRESQGWVWRRCSSRGMTGWIKSRERIDTGHISNLFTHKTRDTWPCHAASDPHINCRLCTLLSKDPRHDKSDVLH